MPQDTDSTRFVTLLNVTEQVQNVQELASVWGTVRRECADVGVEIREAYAVLGEFDFLVVFDAPDRDAAFKAAIIVERHGFDAQTMEVVPTDHLADLVQDI